MPWRRSLFEDHWREKLSRCKPQLVFALPGVERQDSVASGLKVLSLSLLSSASHSQQD